LGNSRILSARRSANLANTALVDQHCQGSFTTMSQDPSQLFSPVASITGDVRIGPMLAIPGLLREFGVTPTRAFNQAGVRLRLFKNSDSRIPFEALARLLNVCARLTACDHFGLLVGERFRLEALGAVGTLMRNSATVGEALRALLLHLHLYDRGAVPVLLELDPSSLLLGYAAYGQRMPLTAQAYDAAVAIGFRAMQELCGPSWTPLRVQFSRLRPTDTAAYRRLFRSRLRFDAEACGVVFASASLDQPIAGADPALRDLLARAIEDAESRNTMSFAEQVECALLQLALNGTASARDVSRFFGIHDRTLRKRLRAEGTSLQTLLDRTRFGIAQQLLGETALSVADVSSALRFSDPNVFSRAFRNWAGASPREWRRRLMVADRVR
jgi:AraC-like DNA-binding protein